MVLAGNMAEESHAIGLRAGGHHIRAEPVVKGVALDPHCRDSIPAVPL